MGQVGQGMVQQGSHLRGGHGQQHPVKACGVPFALDAQAPGLGSSGLAREAINRGMQVQQAMVEQGLCPVPNQVVHARRAHPSVSVVLGCNAQFATKGIEHAHRGHAPGAVVIQGARHLPQGEGKALVAHGEVLGTVIKGAKVGVAGGHAAGCARAFLEHTHLVTGTP